MLIVVSPAKKLDYETELPELKGMKATQPRMLARSEKLVAQLRGMTPARLASLMGVSDRIAELNAGRYQQWERPFTRKNARPAVFAFRGDVYAGLGVENFSGEDLAEATKRFRILSGLYGVLRPQDLMQPYRLEMGTPLENEAGADLYALWREPVTRQLARDMREAGTDTLLNLASGEYFKAVDTARLDARVVSPVFQDEKNGRYKIISFYAKKARGIMAAWVLRNRVTRPEKLAEFSEAGYWYCPEESTADRPVFRRAEKAAGAA